MAGIQIGERDKAIQAYHVELDKYEAQRVDHELALRTAFQNLLTHFAQQARWTLIPELTLANGAQPVRVLRVANGSDVAADDTTDEAGDDIPW